ncbi:hypothetical protein [Blastomonas sp. SL216]|nr:hypothetical protein OU999_17095 [Blastomonas sp. SL216]
MRTMEPQISAMLSIAMPAAAKSRTSLSRQRGTASLQDEMGSAIPENS